MGADTVFISYSHDSAEHLERVLAFSNMLRELGVDAELDQYHTRPPQGWPQWCEEQLRPEASKFVLLICTPTYRDRIENKVPADAGRGVYWEGKDIYQYIYDEKTNERFIPVLFGEEPDECIPRRLRGYAMRRVKNFDLADLGFEALYRDLTGQPAVIKPAVGDKVVLGTTSPAAPAVAARLLEKPALTTFATPAPPLVDISRIDRYAPAELIGREVETRLIDEAWAKVAAGEAQPRVLTFVALGGEGKTALVTKWAIAQSAKDWPGCEAAFAWSFYSQGTNDRQTASSDLFLAEALKFLGAPAVEGDESAHDKGRRLAKRIGEKRAVLILDGLEPLQYPPTSPTPGELKDQGLRALLKGLAQRNQGLCLLTTRYRIKDLEGYAATALQRDLAPLSKEAGAKLLERLGVKGTLKERETLTQDVKGHALTLNLIGSYLSDAYGGDIRQRDRIRLEEADAEEQGGHAFRAMDAYARWFEGEDEKGVRALAMLRLVGLFDRPASAGCLRALWKAPAIEGLTESLFDIEKKFFGLWREYRPLDAREVNVILKRLADAKLVTVNWDAGGALVSLDAHPLLREYFAKDLRETRRKAWRGAHKRIYEHLVTTTRHKFEQTLDDLQPLYQAVAHGCYAGMHQEACAHVYRGRILRGTGSGGFYSTAKLGAFGADLGAVACFFELPWGRVSPNIAASDRAWLLGEAAFSLRALGRLTEALEPTRAGLEMPVEQADWQNAARTASNLSELELTLGELDAAIRDGAAAVSYADRSGDAFRRMGERTTHANALHQAGRRPEAEARFVEAEAMQAERAPPYPPLLYSLQGFRYCDLLLGDAERAAWRRLVGQDLDAEGFQLVLAACQCVLIRGQIMFKWRAPNDPLFDIELDHLTLARASLYQAILRAEPPAGAHVKDSLDFLRRAGQQHFLPLGLPAPSTARRPATSTGRARTSTRRSRSPSAGRCGSISPTSIPIARGC
jgi:hypothetical protein